MFCFVLTSPPLMLCVYLQTFEAALFWKKKKSKKQHLYSFKSYLFNDCTNSKSLIMDLTGTLILIINLVSIIRCK